MFDESPFSLLIFNIIESAQAQPVRGAFPSPSVQILPMMVARKEVFINARDWIWSSFLCAARRLRCRRSSPIRSILFSPSDRKCRQYGRETISCFWLNRWAGRLSRWSLTPDIQKIADLKGKKIGVTFGGSTAAGTKALLELNKINPDKDVEYIGLPGNEPKIAAMKQGIISAALLAPPADYLAMKAGLKRLVSLGGYFQGYGIHRPGGA